MSVKYKATYIGSDGSQQNLGYDTRIGHNEYVREMWGLIPVTELGSAMHHKCRILEVPVVVLEEC